MIDDFNSLRAALESSELFRGTDLSSLKSCFVLSFKRGEAVSETQNGTDCVGLVVSGSLTVTAQEQSSVSVMKRGGEFGICNIFVGEKMPTKLRARVQSKVMFLPKDDFARLLGEDKAMMYRYVKLCNEKMIYLATRLRLLSITDCRERLMFYLESKSADGVVRLDFPKDSLAKLLGISRSSLFRAFRELEAENKIVCGAKGIVFIAPTEGVKV